MVQIKLSAAFIAAAAIAPVFALPVGDNTLKQQSVFMSMCPMNIFEFVADIRNTVSYPHTNPSIARA